MDVMTAIGATVRRTFDVDRANAVINDPSVRPFVGAPDAGDLDLFKVIAEPENWCLMGDHGGFVLTWSAPRIHEVHTFILPAGRGKWARQAAAEGIRYAKDQGDTMLWTKVRPELRNVAAYACGMGMRPTGETVNMFGKPHRIFSMEISSCQ